MNKHKVVWILALALTLLVSAMRLELGRLGPNLPLSRKLPGAT